MNRSSAQEKKLTIRGILSLVLASVGLILVLVLSVSAARELSEAYRSAEQADLSVDVRLSLGYSDHLYVQLINGIELLRNDPDNEAQLADFLSSSLRVIEERISAAGIIYTMMISIVLALFLYERYRDRKVFHVLAAALSPLCICGLFLTAEAAAFLILRIPLYMPAGFSLCTFLVGLVSLSGGACALAWLLRRVRIRTVLAVLAIPAGFLVITTGMLAEAGLFAVPEKDSFEYVLADIPEDYEGELYYDSEKNVIVRDGTEFEPEIIQNPDHLKGAKRAGAVLYEILNPYSGNGIDMVRLLDEDEKIPGWVLPLYLLKAAVWIVLPLRFQSTTDSRQIQ